MTDDETLDTYRSILQAVVLSPQAVPPVLMAKMLDSLASAFTAAVEDTSRHVDNFGLEDSRERSQVLEIYAFLLSWFVLGAEKYKGTDSAKGGSVVPKPRRGRGGKVVANARAKKNVEWTWAEHVAATLELTVKVLRISSEKIWTTTADRDTVLE